MGCFFFGTLLLEMRLGEFDVWETPLMSMGSSLRSRMNAWMRMRITTSEVGEAMAPGVIRDVSGRGLLVVPIEEPVCQTDLSMFGQGPYLFRSPPENDLLMEQAPGWGLDSLDCGDNKIASAIPGIDECQSLKTRLIHAAWTQRQNLLANHLLLFMICLWLISSPNDT